MVENTEKPPGEMEILHRPNRQGSLLIRCLHVHKIYGPYGPVLEDFSLEIRQGEFLFLLGAGRTGKSTFLRLLLGLEAPDQGYISIEGRNIHQIHPSEIPHFRRHIGAVFQDLRILMRKSVSANVALPLDVAGSSGLFVRRKVHSALRAVGLEQKMDISCEHLSASELQRVAIARAIVGDPVILLADEPTANQDMEDTRMLMSLFRNIHMRGTTVIFATRNPELPAMVWENRTVYLHEGRIKEQPSASHYRT